MASDFATLRDGVTLVAPRGRVTYLDSQSMDLPGEMTPLQVWDRIMGAGLPLLPTAMRLRDRIGGLFGIAPIHGFSRVRSHDPRPGEKLDFFTVEAIGPTAMDLVVRDHHLDVLVSVLTGDRRLTITASVASHNLTGRLYMLPVGPAHRLIVRAMLRRLRRTLADETRAAKP